MGYQPVSKVPDIIRIKVARLGSPLQEVAICAGDTVRKALDVAGANYYCCDISTEEKDVLLETRLYDSCMLFVKPQETPLVAASGAYMTESDALRAAQMQRRRAQEQMYAPSYDNIFQQLYKTTGTIAVETAMDKLEEIQEKLGMGSLNKEQRLRRSIRKKKEKIRSIKAARKAKSIAKKLGIGMAITAVIIFAITLMMNFNHKEVEIDPYNYYVEE